MTWINGPLQIAYHFLFTGRTHVRIKGQNLNFYLETHATPNDIYFIVRLRILPRILGTLYWRVDDPVGENGLGDVQTHAKLITGLGLRGWYTIRAIVSCIWSKAWVCYSFQSGSYATTTLCIFALKAEMFALVQELYNIRLGAECLNSSTLIYQQLT